MDFCHVRAGFMPHHRVNGLPVKNAMEELAMKWNLTIWRALVVVSTLVSAVVASGASDKW